MDIKQLILDSENKLTEVFRGIDEIALWNQKKVLDAFAKNRIALRHFYPSTGYGYGDDSRDTLNLLFKDVFGAEKAVVSPNILSGTHALTVGLFGILRPGDTMLAITGNPYDTLSDVISGEGNGSLKDFGVKFQSIPLKNNKVDFDAVRQAIAVEKPKMVFMQRSRGYEWREAISVDEIGKTCDFLRSIGFDGCIFVDNCYGEFVDVKEPTEVGADVVAGSLIKNPGGGIAPTGGYLAGKEKYITLIENRLTAPSIGGEVGSYAFTYQYFYQGLFLAPHVVAQAVKGAWLIGVALSSLGYETSPCLGERAGDIIRAVKFGNAEDLISFIQSVQKVSPIDSFVSVLPWDMPGYDSPVIMAAGCFVQGASIELSADAPVKPPYVAYLQGGLTYEHCKIALEEILKNLKKH